MLNGISFSSGRGASATLLGGIFLTSLSVLALEITFGRILSVILSYHYVFVVVSMAMAGLACGGTSAYLFKRLGAGSANFASLALFAGLFSLSIPVAILAVTRLPYTQNVLPYSLIMMAPFFLSGVIISLGFRLLSAQSGKVYAADLLGAAAGALLIIPLLDWLGALNAGLLLGVVAAVACCLFAASAKKQAAIWTSSVNAFALTALLLFGIVFPGLQRMPIDGDPAKELFATLRDTASGPSIVESRWNSFGRTDLVRYQNEPDIMTMYIDGTAGTSMYRFSGDLDNPGSEVESLKVNFAGYFPFQFLEPAEKDNALIIGPGGGRDVLVALVAGVRQITGVDVNGDFVDVVKRYSSFNGGIYRDFPNVNVVVAEGRSFLRQQTQKFDIIMLSLPLTKTSPTSAVAYLSRAFLNVKLTLHFMDFESLGKV